MANQENARYINLPNRPALLPFSDAVQAGETLYLSGHIGIDPATGVVPSDVNHELQLLFQGFEATLRHSGMTMDDLVSVQIFSPELSLWETFNAEYVKRFSGKFPARAFIGSGPLLKGGRFEMMGIAVRRPR
ncbi:MAG: RidA family protein [Acidobacteria bacterium]|jgi:enamine deaminase RidA (YjgF/YER057c/UK114 family)|nr:MAG: RidA family protein [Acidobacteriota bacterium]